MPLVEKNRASSIPAFDCVETRYYKELYKWSRDTVTETRRGPAVPDFHAIYNDPGIVMNHCWFVGGQRLLVLECGYSKCELRFLQPLSPVI